MTSGDRKLLFGAALGFIVLIGAWTALFLIASRHRVAEVPLAHKNHGPAAAPQR